MWLRIVGIFIVLTRLYLILLPRKEEHFCNSIGDKKQIEGRKDFVLI